MPRQLALLLIGQLVRVRQVVIGQIGLNTIIILPLPTNHIVIKTEASLNYLDDVPLMQHDQHSYLTVPPPRQFGVALQLLQAGAILGFELKLHV